VIWYTPSGYNPIQPSGKRRFPMGDKSPKNKEKRKKKQANKQDKKKAKAGQVSSIAPKA
jgi:hypothetical protein